MIAVGTLFILLGLLGIFVAFKENKQLAKVVSKQNFSSYLSVLLCPRFCDNCFHLVAHERYQFCI